MLRFNVFSQGPHVHENWPAFTSPPAALPQGPSVPRAMPSRLRLTRVRFCKLIHFARLSCQVNVTLKATARLLRQINAMLVPSGRLLRQVDVIRLSAGIGYLHDAVVLANRYMRRGDGGVERVDAGCRSIPRAQYAHDRLCDIIVWCSVLRGHVASGIRVVEAPIEELGWGLVTRRGLTRDVQVLAAGITGTVGVMWRPAICINEVLVRGMVIVGARHGKPRQQSQSKMVTERLLNQDEEC